VAGCIRIKTVKGSAPHLRVGRGRRLLGVHPAPPRRLGGGGGQLDDEGAPGGSDTTRIEPPWPPHVAGDGSPSPILTVSLGELSPSRAFKDPRKSSGRCQSGVAHTSSTRLCSRRGRR